jgi:hypothetical protein
VVNTEIALCWWVNPDASPHAKYSVTTQYCRATFDLDCHWEGLPPVYRVFVNGELFSEREWRWTDCYLTEILQISAPPGRYVVRVEPVGPNLATFSTRNHQVEHGSARWIDSQHLEIMP